MKNLFISPYIDLSILLVLKLTSCQIVSKADWFSVENGVILVLNITIVRFDTNWRGTAWEKYTAMPEYPLPPRDWTGR